MNGNNNISSDDEEYSISSDLPASKVHKRHSSSTLDLYECDKPYMDDDCVDLTQESGDEDKHEPVGLTGSGLSPKERVSGEKAVAFVQSDGAMKPVDPGQLSPTTIALLRPGASGVSGVSLQSGGSTATLSSASSGHTSVTASSSKRQSVDSRATKKRRLEEERRERAAANERAKIYRPKECMRYMVIELHPLLHETWYMANLNLEAEAAAVRVQPSKDVFHEHLVLWSRRAERRIASEAGQMKLTDAMEPCHQALLVESAEEIAPYVKAHTLSSRVAQMRDIINCKLTLVVFGGKDYFKTSGRKKMTEIELEMALTDLLVSADCDAIQLATASDLALTVLQFTKAIAEAPHKQAKRACDEQAEFYMRGDNKNCVSVDKDGHGAARLWQQMLAVLPHSSLEVARSVARVHGAPSALCEALERPNAVNELADIGVDRAGVPGSRARRLGPEFARRLHTLFTAEDGNMLVE